MTHEFSLNHRPFCLIKSGLKTIEMRLYDERRKRVKIGDFIEFTDNDNGERITAEVINLFVFSNFAELYDHFDKSKLGYSSKEKADPKDMNQYYTDEQINKFGVVGIEILIDD